MSQKAQNSDPRLPRRVRNELRFRQISVASKTRVANCFWRIAFTGSDLDGFNSPSFDDHIKLFFPDEATHELPMPQMTDEGVVWPGNIRPTARDYTPLAFDGKENLTMDFYIHEGGVASSWADRAQSGDRLVIGGPRGSQIIPEDYAFQIYLCDESGLPALKRRLPAIQAEALHVLVYADEATGRDYLGDTRQLNIHWLGNGKMDLATSGEVIGALDKISLPDEDYFIWLTGEGETVKMLGDYFIQRRGCDARLVHAKAYWHRKPAKE